VDCVAEFERYSLKTIKKDLLKKLSPRPAAVAKQHEDPDSSIADYGDLSRLPLPAVGRTAAPLMRAMSDHGDFYAAGNKNAAEGTLPPI